MTYSESLARLTDGYWNSGAYDASTNPGGLANGGHRQVSIGTTRNFDVLMGDIAIVSSEGAGSALAAVAATGLAWVFVWDADTADSDQGSGKIWIDNAAAGSATTVYISDTDAGGVDRSSQHGRFTASSSTVKGDLGLVKVGDTSAYLYGDVTATTDASGYLKITISNADASGGTPFTADDQVVIGFIRNGDKGDPGAGSVTVSPNDTTGGELEGKLLPGTGIEMTTQNEGGNETRTVALDLTLTMLSARTLLGR